jgi:hypothetical protein
VGQDKYGSDGKGRVMLARARVAARLPAQDLERARAFNAEKLGLEPAEERPDGLRYLSRSGEFAQLAFEVENIEVAVAELPRRFVVFEDYDAPGLTTVDGIADIDGNYPGKGKHERGAWFPTARATCSGSANQSPELAARSCERRIPGFLAQV